MIQILLIVLSFVMGVIQGPSQLELAKRSESLVSDFQRIAEFSTFPAGASLLSRLPYNQDAYSGMVQVGGDVVELSALKPLDIQEPLELSFRAALAVDGSNRMVLYRQNEDQRVVLASLTKLMTALVVMDQAPDWDQYVELLEADRAGGEVIKISEGDTVRLSDLLHASLIQSANNATVALVRGSGLTQEEAVARMNVKAQHFGLSHTVFTDVTGLDGGNVSTPKEFAVIASRAFSVPRLMDALRLPKYTITTTAGTKRTMISTNRLLGEGGVVAGKTGYIVESGYNFVSLSERFGRMVLTLGFGAPSNEARFNETGNMLEWIDRNFVEMDYTS